MPELPEVETTVRGLAPVLEGQRIARIVTRRADLRFPFPRDLGQRLVGARVTRLGRRAKYGLIGTDRGDTLVFHLGMSGRWRVDPDMLGAHDHLVIEMGSGHTLALNDPRRFGFVHLHATDDLPAYPPFVAMGPEPLGTGLTADHLLARFEGRAAPVKALLLDQRVVAGLGNIYVCEALHTARIAPNRAGGRIALFRLERLVEAIRTVLEAAIAVGGSSIRDYARPDGELGYFSKQWRVYGREGEACGCGTIVRRRVEGGRSTFWCPACQRG
ncbi:bifunctional DNA-formamidopyrimidine glycosylase/DNA-(apurinic or apyrimidinic site) lyase [uncultured Sphingomonas sp.]|uniref:bifunctional DNA-formamidopyrimidine glycosylase/DNA-(apurinic or apyrimidinic site) lyase n=1 Tax=uncultured Sphingomonas sp. TaxID=158754 RepID=UPI0035C9B6BA